MHFQYCLSPAVGMCPKAAVPQRVSDHRFTCNQQGSGLPRAGAIAEDMHIIAQHSSGNLPLELTPSKHAEEYATGLVSSIACSPAAEAFAGRCCRLSTSNCASTVPASCRR
jgi:hypothetical protein